MEKVIYIKKLERNYQYKEKEHNFDKKKIEDYVSEKKGKPYKYIGYWFVKDSAALVLEDEEKTDNFFVLKTDAYPRLLEWEYERETFLKLSETKAYLCLDCETIFESISNHHFAQCNCEDYAAIDGGKKESYGNRFIGDFSKTIPVTFNHYTWEGDFSDNSNSK